MKDYLLANEKEGSQTSEEIHADLNLQQSQESKDFGKIQQFHSINHQYRGRF